MANKDKANRPNRLSTVVGTVNKLPVAWRAKALSLVMGRVIPFAGTAGTRVEKLTPQECVIVMRNKKKVQNHIGSVHAAAMGLLAESATGFMTGMSVPDDRIIVIRSMQLEYLKRASGDMKAVARFSDEQLEYVKNTEKGDIEVPVVITDGSGTETVKATMVWAWTPKKK
ncbi:MAG: DUF4442 domain-containing protein [Saccharospirillaceae bacterium]|nr:DUF4442 domain-containing protein [Saccharospirillaceae bacterium]MCD8532413.1 DUF4442 domain-containing protein [Saccharospirillaceae bacterium]